MAFVRTDEALWTTQGPSTKTPNYAESGPTDSCAHKVMLYVEVVTDQLRMVEGAETFRIGPSTFSGVADWGYFFRLNPVAQVCASERGGASGRTHSDRLSGCTPEQSEYLSLIHI